MTRKIYVLDTTLRDGEQVPGAKLNLSEKLVVAKQIAKMKVDMMEVGFPSSSQGDFEAVRAISQQVGQEVGIAALGRAVQTDIDCIYESIKNAQNPLIHIVLGASDVHVGKNSEKLPSRSSIWVLPRLNMPAVFCPRFSIRWKMPAVLTLNISGRQLKPSLKLAQPSSTCRIPLVLPFLKNSEVDWPHR